jgi:hypothetical protein
MKLKKNETQRIEKKAPTSPQTKKVLVQVTKTDITRGVVCDPEKCMVARAMNRLLKRKHAALVSTDGYRVCNLGDPVAEGVSGALPRVARRNIYRYDVHGKKAIKPFRFTARLPVDSLKAV